MGASKTVPCPTTNQDGNHDDNQPGERERGGVKRRRQDSTVRASEKEHGKEGRGRGDDQCNNEGKERTKDTHASWAA